MGDQGAKLSVRYFAALPEPEGRPDAFHGSILLEMGQIWYDFHISLDSKDSKDWRLTSP